MGRVILIRDGCFYRVQCDPVDALPPSFARPTTFISHCLATNTAGLLGEATGFPVADMTQMGNPHG
jgi:hypothetical protein